ncbi:hypothetical protein QE152_g38844 [Popillia japonica]|uniref:Uncharacterized protein n=1 Tax=Popillia japonica TaxID=7064 RepID=A0AAW1HW62_POPJA
MKESAPTSDSPAETAKIPSSRKNFFSRRCYYVGANIYICIYSDKGGFSFGTFVAVRGGRLVPNPERTGFPKRVRGDDAHASNPFLNGWMCIGAGVVASCYVYGSPRRRHGVRRRRSGSFARPPSRRLKCLMYTYGIRGLKR